MANNERIANVAGIITDTYKAGNRVVVSVSAQGDTTDDLITKAAGISDRCSRREMDVLLSTGEQISIALLSMAIEKLGFPVISLTGWQAGIRTDDIHGSARIINIETGRILEELGKNNIVVVAGFQGIDSQGNITTLGRGASDLTAVALASFLKADLCQIYTDVDGVYTTDPRLVSNARKLKEINFDEMLELSSLGAQVLQNRSVEMAKRYHVNLEVLSSFKRAPGTKVKEASDTMQNTPVRGVARDDNVARISILGVPDEPGIAFRLFSLLGEKRINVDVILQSIGRDGTKDISFTVSSENLETALSQLKGNTEFYKGKGVTFDDNISKVSIVGAGMATNPGIAAKMFEALFDAGINIKMISTSEIKISVLIDRSESSRAVRVIHEYFGLATDTEALVGTV